ncbi:MAG TPA: hypothetical protein VFT01_08860 [Homoserinimonas sp.]|nr:hypothetical protein [Homoserinimonas sp.]
MGAIRRCAVGALVVVASATLAACTDAPQQSPEPTQVTQPSSVSPAPEPEPEPDPVLDPDGTAEDNLRYFDFVNAKVLTGGNPGGQAIIDNLVAAGFDKSAMQVTADRTPRGTDVDSLQFSVRIGEECLIGQADGRGYISTLAPALESGSCLVGKTRAIDW